MSLLARIARHSLTRTRVSRPSIVLPCSIVPESTSCNAHSFSSRPRYQIPKGSFDLKVRYVVSLVPVGSMDANIIGFCVKSIKSLAKSSSEEARHAARRLLRRLEQEALVQHAKVSLTTSLYYGVLKRSSVSSALELLQNMQDQHQSHPDTFPAPDIGTYEAVLQAFAYSQDENDNADQQAQALVQQVERVAETTSGAIQPTKALYDSLILVHANRAPYQYGAAAAAEDWLMHQSRLSANGQEHLQPDRASFNRVLKAWSISPETNGAERALEILQLMMELGDDAAPDAVSYATVITAFAHRNLPERAEETLRQAVDYFDGLYGDVTDLQSCLNVALMAWAKSQHPEAGQRAKTLLEDAYTLSRGGGGHPRIQMSPTAGSHALYMEALIKSQGDLGLEQAELNLRAMIQGCTDRSQVGPATVNFHMVLHGLLRSDRPDRAARSTRWLHEMLYLAEKVGLENCQPETGTFNMILESWCQSELPETPREVKRLVNLAEARQLSNSFTYVRAINALCRTGASQDAYEAAGLLQRLEQQVDKRTLDWVPKQMVGLYTAVIRALAAVKTPQASELALAILKSMPSSGKRAAEPTVRTYTAAMHACLPLRGQRAVEAVTELFEAIQTRDADPKSKVRLDVVVFRTIFETLYKAGGPQSIEKSITVLTSMLELYRGGRNDLEPCARCLSAPLKALLAANDSEHVSKAAKLLIGLLQSRRDSTLQQKPFDSVCEEVVRRCEAHSLHEQAKALAALMEAPSTQSRIPL